MAELTTKELLQPSLLDRLTDKAAEKKLETLRERVMSFNDLRKSVIRDLEWLFNTVHIEAFQDLSDHPETRRSTINYGITDLAGVWAANKDSEIMERELRQAITDFEPRILPDSLEIHVTIDTDEMSPTTMTFEIVGELWWQPLPERFYLKTTLDIELGRFKNESGE